jgi:hypothetical protein
MKKAMCYLCCGEAVSCLNAHGCPLRCAGRKPPTARPYHQQSPQAGPSQGAYTRPATPNTFPRRSGIVLGNSPLLGVGTVPGVGPVVHAVEERFPDEEVLNEDVLTSTVAENAVGRN